jgi:hypothetical protein
MIYPYVFFLECYIFSIYIWGFDQFWVNFMCIVYGKCHYFFPLPSSNIQKLKLESGR